MGSAAHRTPKSGRQSLFYQDLATPVSSRRPGGKFSTPGQAAAVSALWRENFSNSDLPPPPVFTLEDRSDFSPEVMEYSTSPEVRSDLKTPFKSGSKEPSTPPKGKSDVASTSYSSMGKNPVQQTPQTPIVTSAWWSASKSSGSMEQEEKAKGSPVEGVVNSGALITLPPPREVARPEMKRSNVSPVGNNLDEEEWVTVYGFSPAETNMVLREFEKCGVILKHVPGPREANWMHILYQNRFDAQKALNKNGTQLNGVLIIGVKPVDPMQRQALNEKLNHQGFTPLPPFSSRASESKSFQASPSPYPLQNGSSSTRAAGTVATPTKSYMSKIADLMFGV